jgi:rhodanese-related sulfurtransferase
MRSITSCRQIFWGFLALALFFTPLARAEVINVDNAALKQLIADGVPVVDIRHVDEWQQTGIIKDSHLITLPVNKAGNAYDIAAWHDAFSKVIQPSQPVIIICRTGNRSKPVTSYLDQRAGYTKVYNVTEGIARWIKDGNPTVPYQEKPTP